MMTWAVKTPLGSTHDEWFHLRSIWSKNGVDATDCKDFNEPVEFELELQFKQLTVV